MTSSPRRLSRVPRAASGRVSITMESYATISRSIARGPFRKVSVLPTVLSICFRKANSPRGSRSVSTYLESIYQCECPEEKLQTMHAQLMNFG